jgi:hypothetical protein
MNNIYYSPQSTLGTQRFLFVFLRKLCDLRGDKYYHLLWLCLFSLDPSPFPFYNQNATKHVTLSAAKSLACLV